MSETKHGGFWKHPLAVLVWLTLGITLVAAILWALGYPVVGTVVGMMTILLWLLVIIVATALVVSWWSATLMERGANIALTAQVSDDKRDVQLLKTAGDVTRTVLRQSHELPTLPLPQQQPDWRPAWPELDVVDVEVK